MKQQLCFFPRSSRYLWSGSSCGSFHKAHTAKKTFCPRRSVEINHLQVFVITFFDRAVAVAIATTVLTTPPFFRKANKNVFIFSSMLSCRDKNVVFSERKHVIFALVALYMTGIRSFTITLYQNDPSREKVEISFVNKITIRINMKPMRCNTCKDRPIPNVFSSSIIN